jgi:DNA-binding PadR family transcriptional regulator
MNEQEMDDQDFSGRWSDHPHRHHGGRRFRSRFGPPGFDRGADEPGMPEMSGRPGRAGRPGRPGRPVRPERPDRAEFGGGGRGGFGPGFHPGAGFYGGPPGFGPWSRGYGRRGSRAKRGDVRAAALALLAEEPMNGYQIIQQISDRSGGIWRPSPGSVYPALAQLEDEGLIVQQATAGERRAYALTDAGRSYVAKHADELKAPWSALSGNAASAAADLHSLVRQVHIAAFGVLSAGTDAQMAEARKILAQTRRSLYRILAEEEEADPQAAGKPDTGDVRADEGPDRD